MQRVPPVSYTHLDVYKRQAPAPAPVAAEPGGYVPTPEERVPGITIDASAQPVTEATLSLIHI